MGMDWLFSYPGGLSALTVFHQEYRATQRTQDLLI